MIRAPAPGTDAGRTELSDHIGVTADINRYVQYCSARSPWLTTIDPAQVITPQGQIRYAGELPPADSKKDRFFHRDLFAFDKGHHAAILE